MVMKDVSMLLPIVRMIIVDLDFNKSKSHI